MLRVHFTGADLLRVRFAARPAPLLELGLAVAMLQRHDHADVFGRWRTSGRRGLPAAAAALTALVPPNGAGPMFLDPPSDGLEDGVDQVLSAPQELVSTELRRVCPAYRPVTPWVRDLERRDDAAWRMLEQAVRAAHQALVDDDWRRMRASFSADLSWRSRLLAEHGTGVMLASLYPDSSWSGTTLSVGLPQDADLTLTGSGLTLMPSSVWTGQPLVGRDEAGRPLLVYPALTPLPLIAHGSQTDALATLLGRTRAGVLRSASRQPTTAGIAADLEISAASASQHASTRRAAGLVTSSRDGRCVRHSLTPLGVTMLSGP